MKKMIVPVLITVIFVIYFLFYAFGIVWMIPNNAAKILFGVIPAALAAVMIYVCVQRIKEIRSGEHNDLSKY